MIMKMKVIDIDGCLWSSVLVITQQDWFGVLSSSLQGHCFQTIWFLVIVFWLFGSWSLFSDYLVPGLCFLAIWIEVIVSRPSGSLSFFLIWFLVNVSCLYQYLVSGHCFLSNWKQFNVFWLSGSWSMLPMYITILFLVIVSDYLYQGHYFWLSIKVIVFWLFWSRSLFSDCFDQDHFFLTVWIKVIVFWLFGSKSMYPDFLFSDHSFLTVKIMVS